MKRTGRRMSGRGESVGRMTRRAAGGSVFAARGDRVLSHQIMDIARETASFHRWRPALCCKVSAVEGLRSWVVRREIAAGWSGNDRHASAGPKWMHRAAGP